MFEKIKKGQWWDFPLGLVSGCSPLSPACANCWLLGMRKRFKQGIESVRFNPEPLNNLTRKKPAAYAVWSDLYHESISYEQISWATGRFLDFPQHLFLALTKRPERANIFHDHISAPKNLWVGTTIENQEWMENRIHDLLAVKANLFLSVEPMLGPVNISEYLKTDKIKWVICGCENGPGRRLTNTDWVRDLRDQCVRAKVPFFLKQLEKYGEVFKAPELDVVQWLQLPEGLDK